MGTRGLIGFHYLGVTKAQYNHFDSYPDALGQQAIQDLQEHDLTIDQLRALFIGIVLVANDRERPTLEQQQRYRKFADTNVSTSSLDDWYCLLRNTQDGLAAWLSGDCQHMQDGADFIDSSLFCEYAYIVDLDEGRFEAYQGFQRQPHQQGRYAREDAVDGYYPCALVASWPLDRLPTTAELKAAYEEEG